MIWFFDSGIGGLTVMREFRRVLPRYDCLYYGDTLRCPYGGLDDATIRQYTEDGVKKLFDEWAEIVILACNTATAHAIRYLQQVRFPNRKILGVTIPGAERIAESGYRKVGILATESTVKNRAYRERVHIIDDSIGIQEVAAPELVPLIEAGIVSWPRIDRLLAGYVGQFDPDIEAIVLGCTHYPYVRTLIEAIRRDVDIVDPGYEAAQKFVAYLARHPEIERKLSRGGRVREMWSGRMSIVPR